MNIIMSATIAAPSFVAASSIWRWRLRMNSGPRRVSWREPHGVDVKVIVKKGGSAQDMTIWLASRTSATWSPQLPDPIFRPAGIGAFRRRASGNQ